MADLRSLVTSSICPVHRNLLFFLLLQDHSIKKALVGPIFAFEVLKVENSFVVDYYFVDVFCLKHSNVFFERKK